MTKLLNAFRCLCERAEELVILHARTHTHYGLDGPGIVSDDPSSRAVAGIADSNPAGSMDICDVCCRGISDMMIEDIKVHNGGKGQNERKRESTKKKFPVGARFSSPVHTGPGALPARYTLRTGSLSRG